MQKVGRAFLFLHGALLSSFRVMLKKMLISSFFLLETNEYCIINIPDCIKGYAARLMVDYCFLFIKSNGGVIRQTTTLCHLHCQVLLFYRQFNVPKLCMGYLALFKQPVPK